MRHVMKLGPLPVARGTAYAYVAFGEVGLDVVVEANDDKGLAALAVRTRGDVLVCEPALAPAAVRRGLTVGVPPQEAAAMKAALAVTLSHGPALGRISPDLVLELIEATLDFDEAAPWQLFGSDEAISVRIEPGGREREACVLGQGGEEFGLALYHQRGSVQKALEFTRSGRPEAARALASTTMLIDRDDSFAVDSVEEMADVALAPIVIHRTRGKAGPPSSRDVAGLVAALRAITALAIGEEARGESLDDETVVVAEATRGATRTVSTYEGVGRNEPCPCGSGRKFKRCHATAVTPGAPLHVRDERVVGEILDFGLRRFGAAVITSEVQRAVGTRGASMQLVSPLTAYVLLFEGKTLAEHFLDAAPSGLRTDDRTWIQQQLETPLSIWEVLSVERGKGLEVVDLFTGRRCFVNEILGSQALLPRHAVLGRVVLGEPNVFCGMHESPLAPMDADEIVQRERPRDAHGLIEAWHQVLEKVELEATMPVVVRNTDGHDVSTVEDQFAIERGAFQRAVQGLAALEGTIVDEHTAKGASLTFTRPGNATHASWENTIIGSARLTPTRIVVTTNSLERAELLAQRLRLALAGLATWKKRESKELPPMLGGKTVLLDGQAMQTASVVDTYRGWLDSPSPRLEGRTPRAAVEDAAGRAVVHVMLKDAEHLHAREPVDGVDPSQWRRELGLDLLGQLLPDLDLDRALGSGRKLTDTVMDFARPMIDAGPDPDERGMRAVLEFAIRVWNAIVDEDTGGTPRLAEIRAALVAGRAPAESVEWHDRLVARKRERFGADLRLVGTWKVHQHRADIQVQMEIRVPTSLHEQMKRAGYPGA